MKSLLAIAATFLIPKFSMGQVASDLAPQPDPDKPLLVVETSCGECNYGMPGDGCDVAVALPAGTYYVDGVGISEYGHPHAKNGFCVALRQAEVQGEVVNGRFKASYFKLLPPGTDLEQARKEAKKELRKMRQGK